jgi:membrane fusion protein (multidrug efflux system)
MANVEDKIEALRTNAGRAEIDSAAAGANLRPERREAPSLKTTPRAKGPGTVPPGRTADRSAKPAVAPFWRHLPSLRTSLMAAGVFAVLGGSIVFWLRGGRYATTDDAYVQAAKVLVTTDVSGLVSSVKVREGQAVKASDLLFQIDPLQFQIALDSAQANLREIALTIQSMKSDYQVTLSNVAAQQAQVALDQVTNERNAALVNDDNVPRQIYDQSRYMLQLDQNKLVSLQQTAQVQLAKLDGNPDIPVTDHPLYRQAKAQVDEAQRQLNHASVRAPFSGVVTQVDALQPGTFLVAPTAAMTQTGAVALVSDNRMWVTAQMKETDLTYAKPGNHVDLTVDTYPGQVWSGTVESISPASSSEFSVLPAQNSSGNWVKVVQRIPVRIGITRKPGAPALRSGMSVYVSIDTGHRRTLGDLF